MVFRELTLCCVLLMITSKCLHVETRSVVGIRSDVIETKYAPTPAESKQQSFDFNPEDKDFPELESRFGSSDPKKPGWMVRLRRKFFNPAPNNIENEIGTNANEGKRSLLMRFGDITSRVSNNLGGTAMRVAGVIEKLCKMLKTIIPIVAAVCNVGQFKFCSAADAPLELGEVMNRPLDLNAPDR